MRLIDADNFSKKFNAQIYIKLMRDYLNSTADDKTKDVADFVTTDILVVFNNLIDNAPTVEPDISETYGAGYEQGFRHGKEKYERPKGEWIENVQSCKCSKCDSYALYWNDTPVLSNFCPFCGADMKGGKE